MNFSFPLGRRNFVSFLFAKFFLKGKFLCKKEEKMRREIQNYLKKLFSLII